MGMRTVKQKKQNKKQQQKYWIVHMIYAVCSNVSETKMILENNVTLHKKKKKIVI